MQRHWLRWGPPAYIPVAGYFGMGFANKKGRRGKGAGNNRGLPDKPDRPLDPIEKLEDGNFEQLAALFNGGRIG